MNGLAIRPYVYRCQVHTFPYTASSQDTVEDLGFIEERVQVVGDGPHSTLLDVVTNRTTEAPSVDSTRLDRRTLALISERLHWESGVLTQTVRGRHLSALQETAQERDSADTTLGGRAFLYGQEQLFLLALGPPLAIGASFSIPTVLYDGGSNRYVVDTTPIHVTADGRYPAPGGDSTDVWLVNFGGRQLQVAKKSRRILEKRAAWGEDRFMRCVAVQ